MGAGSHVQDSRIWPVGPSYDEHKLWREGVEIEYSGFDRTQVKIGYETLLYFAVFSLFRGCAVWASIGATRLF